MRRHALSPPACECSSAWSVGVIISDTLGRAWREGQTDSAIGAGGVHVFEDLRGQTDAEGRSLRRHDAVRRRRTRGGRRSRQGQGVTDAGRGRARARGSRRVARAPGARSIVRDPERDMFRLGADEAYSAGFAAGAASVTSTAPSDSAPRLSGPLTLPNRRAMGASTRGRAAIQPITMTTSDAAKIQNPTQLIASCDCVHVVQVAQRPGREDEGDVHDDERDEVEHHREVDRARPLHRVRPVQGLGVLRPDARHAHAGGDRERAPR